MKLLQHIRGLALHEDLNFLLTNRIPRIAATHLVGWLSRIRHPWVYRPCLWLWTRFTSLDLSDALHTDFQSLHECFTRALRPGARPVDGSALVVVSPSDGIVGACGPIETGEAGQTQVFQAKGFPYLLEDLLGNSARASHWAGQLAGGHFVTLRLTSAMYHRFHAPDNARLSHVTYISGDTWNVNPIALKRVERLFCKNERAVLHLQLTNGQWLLLVPVAAVLVASMRLHALDVPLNLRYRGPNELPCDAHYQRGEEMGWFEHGSTIIVLAPAGMSLLPGIACGRLLRMGEGLLRKPVP